MKIAIYGGAFNPVHNEHINIARMAQSELGLDKVIIVPTAVSPHKRGYCMTASPRDRLAMCRLAFQSYPWAEVSDCEIKRGGISYSYVTCRHFRKLYKDDELYFIIGADMLASFKFWKEPQEILKCVTLAVCARENECELKSYIRDYYGNFKGELVNFSYVGKPVSSTKIRAMSALGADISAYVPLEVKKHIQKRKLYAIDFVRGVEKYLTKERWEHTVRVAVCSAEHSRQNGVYEYDAIVASALHDCAKYLGDEAEELKGFAFPENTPSAVKHQFSGGYVAEHAFGVTDQNILNAIRYHSTGRECMSSLEKLIYLADLLEEGRDFDGVEKLRSLFDKGLDICLLSALEHQISYLKSTGAPVCNLTQRACNYLKENL